MMIKAINARNGMEINPNQFMYCPVQGTLPQLGAVSARKDSF